MIYVLGTRTTSSEISDLIPPENFGGYIENMWRERHEFWGSPVYWVDKIPELVDARFVCGISSSYQRKLYVEDVQEYGPAWTTIVHSSASVSVASTIGDGSVIGRHSVVASHTTLGEHCFLNRGVLMGHDNSIGNFVTFSPGAAVGGCCIIDDGAYIAMGAVVVDRMHIGKNSFIGAGAVVVRDVPDNTAVVGVPARPMQVKEGSRVLDRIDGSCYLGKD